jgi:hypothetical protein
MINEIFSTNPESFIKFGRGRRIGWRLHMETPISIDQALKVLEEYSRVVPWVVNHKNTTFSNIVF